MNKITTFLWFEGNIEEATDFYLSVFKGSSIIGTMPGADGKPMGITFEIAGQQFIAFNGGPYFKLNEAVSLFVTCEDQEEVDYYWDRLTADGGQESRCGWLKDRFGLSWQIVPTALMETTGGADRAGASRATEAMMGMKKLIVADLRRAYAGR